MATKATEEAKTILKEALKELESSKGSVLTGVQKLYRAATLLDDENIQIWCEIQLGNKEYTRPLNDLISTLLESDNYRKQGKTEDEIGDMVQNAINKLRKLNLKRKIHYRTDELEIKADKYGGGYLSIGAIEEKYNDLIRKKKGNDGTYYQSHLYKHILYVRKDAYGKATKLYNKIVFSDIPQTAFDVLKVKIDDKLLDLDPELSEQLMLAFRGVTTNNSEEWSQALTTCRRLIEKLADNIYPPTDEKIKGRLLGKNQYINRIWAFMDKSIESKSDKELAKEHVDFIGNYLKSLHNKTHKGVHATITRYEAIKVVLHIYLIVGDILNYLEKPPKEDKKLNIHTASLDELQSFLNINKNVAKEIVKLRVNERPLDEKKLGTIKGIGPKTISKAKENFSFEIPD